MESMTEHTTLGYTLDHTVLTYDIETRRRMTVAALVKLMQEAAMQNVIELKVSAWDLEPHNISWVLFRKSLHINRLPRIGEHIRVVTYPAGFEKAFTYRDYKVFNEEGTLLASSSTTWLLLDMAERRMVRIPPFILAFGPLMPPADQCLPRPCSRLPRFEHADRSVPFRVNWHDLDFNGHLNNVYYIQWMLEALPDDVLKTATLQAFDIFYKVEAHWKDGLLSEIQPLDDLRFLHRLIRIEDGKEVAQGMSRFGG